LLMQPTSFIASSAEEAVTQIRARLGPEAVVLNVRPLPANGLARIWQRPMIEVLAHVPEAPDSQAAPISEALAEFRQQLHEIKQQVERRSIPTEKEASNSEADDLISVSAGVPELCGDQWRVGAVLQKAGLLPVHVQKVLDQLHAQHGSMPPGTLWEEIALARAVLADFWRQPIPIAQNSMHVLVGPAGSGKTTCLCKWLTQATLMDGRLARVWRLDGATANMAESLSVYCEILGVPAERYWQPAGGELGEDIGFIDLPGVDWRRPAAVKELGGQLENFGSPHVHLVLNGAYDLSILLAQQRAFSGLPIEDLIVTHLDEEPRWGKVWNLALGTNYSIRHFSTGQNIPGDFHKASAEIVFARQFPVR
jgi:flagellar biosynthesis protein FlhF